MENLEKATFDFKDMLDKKHYILDTNVFLINPLAFEEFYADGENVVCITTGVLNELDKLKTHQTKGRAAREAIRNLLKNIHNLTLLTHLQETTTDDELVAYSREGFIVVTQDKLLQIKAKLVCGQVQDYKKVIITDLPNAFVDNNEPIPLNQFKVKNKKLYTNFEGMEYIIEEPDDVFGISPKNIEQVAAFYALCNPDVPLVAIQGQAGTGKTLLSLAAGLEMTFLSNTYDKISVTRAPIEATKGLGYLPGDIEEKMTPYLQGIYDNIDFIFGKADKKFNQDYIEKNIHINSLGHLRGSSMQNTYFIVDEVQNIHPNEIKMLLSRAGLGTKIILLGDTTQIDVSYLNEQYNGLSYVINKLYGNELFSYVELTDSVRSPLAKLAVEKL
jgi:PhoH-like ATPase